MKKYILGCAALSAAIIFAAFAYPKTVPVNKSNLIEYFYRFDGTSGQESNMSKWTQITQGAYDSLSCPNGSAQGCKIKNTTNSAGHPTSVPLSGGVPVQTGVNTQVKNKP